MLIVVLVYVPVLLDGTYAYGVENYEKNIESTMDASGVRNHFSTDFNTNPNNVNESEGFSMLKERTNIKNHFSYEYTCRKY